MHQKEFSMDNLRSMASQIALSIRPASDVDNLDTAVDRVLVLNWAQAQALRSPAPNPALLNDLHGRLETLRRPQDSKELSA